MNSLIYIKATRIYKGRECIEYHTEFINRKEAEEYRKRLEKENPGVYLSFDFKKTKKEWKWRNG
ncbi:hypothetical protein [Laceyella putida]|uniref:Uncharacterized protein n=1 Tax=Laceyella putida TaxID=110101 RepID=A0ABW2RRA4_9BACL